MTPLCDKCGAVCYVCPQCNAEFICSCDVPEHNCPCKEIKGIAGNPLGLYLKLINIDGVDKVFEADAKLDIECNGTPILKGWHINKEGEDRDENSFRYTDGYWMLIFPELENIADNEMSGFEPDYSDYHPEYETSLDEPDDYSDYDPDFRD